MSEQSETYFDRPLRFSIPVRHARGRAIRLGPVLDTILSAHAYPNVIAALLAEALTLGALIGSLLKEAGGQLTMQAQTENGVVRLLVVDFLPVSDDHAELRGYVDFDGDRLAEMGTDPSLFALFGKGYLAITFDRAGDAAKGDDGRYQGIVPLEGESLSEAVEQYFERSEQVPTLIRVAVSHSGTNGSRRHIAGGLMLQHMAEGEEGGERLHVREEHPEWEHVRILSETIARDELADTALPMEEILWRLFHEEDEVRIEQGAKLSRGCRCSEAHIRDVIGRFPEEERKDMANDDGLIVVDCAFCSKAFPISPEDIVSE